ncbi:MAG TPA: hypothetical protein VJU78_07700, partial [Chitinophagaceae bacterium]|nr:hypothetical protein [Chitinophagaceae bacterium]
MGFYTVNCFSVNNITWDKKPLFEISKDTICIWQIRIIPDASRIEGLSAVLKSDELARANRYRHEKDRRRFITSRGSLRILLANYLKKEPVDIEFDITPDKKPILKSHVNNLHFNTSHSEDFVLIAIAGSEVGIDVEKTDSTFDWEDIL